MASLGLLVCLAIFSETEEDWAKLFEGATVQQAVDLDQVLLAFEEELASHPYGYSSDPLNEEVSRKAVHHQYSTTCQPENNTKLFSKRMLHLPLSELWCTLEFDKMISQF